VSVNHGSGDYASVTTGQKWETGSTVLIAAYSTLLGVKVRNPTTDGWIGSVEYSSDGGDSYVPFLCTDCTVGSSTASILVDGDSAPTTQVTTCLDGNSCILVAVTGVSALFVSAGVAAGQLLNG